MEKPSGAARPSTLMFGPCRLSSMLMVACSRAWLRRTALTTRFSIYASVSEYITSLLKLGAASLRRQPADGPGLRPFRRRRALPVHRYEYEPRGPGVAQRLAREGGDGEELAVRRPAQRLVEPLVGRRQEQGLAGVQGDDSNPSGLAAAGELADSYALAVRVPDGAEPVARCEAGRRGQRRDAFALDVRYVGAGDELALDEPRHQEGNPRRVRGER